jgi:hypothetical protein
MTEEWWRLVITILWFIFTIVNVYFMVRFAREKEKFQSLYIEAVYALENRDRDYRRARGDVQAWKKKYQDAVEVVTTEDDMEYIRESLRRAADGDPTT